MKKRHFALLRAVCLLLCIALLFSLPGCSSDESEEPAAETVPTTNTYLVKNGVSPYRILIPADASTQIQFAAKDLQFFFEEATGVTLQIVDTAEDTKGKYLSIGNTDVFRASGMTVTYDELGNDGCKTLTFGDAIVMAGVTDLSSTFAVYDFLGKQFGLEIYGDDVYEIRKEDTAKLVDLNWTDVPDIAFRCGGNSFSWYGTREYMSRMRWRTNMDGWAMSTHTYFINILPPSKYLADHPDWYNDPENPDDICMTNEEMKAQFIANVEQIILDHPDCIYYMLGHEDGSPICNCKNCQAVRDQYGGINAALANLFLNDVVRQINAWAKETCPDRVLKFVGFAYTSTEIPPVQFDEATGEYYPYNHDEKLILEDNLGIMIAPIGVDISSPYLEGNAKGTFEGWAALTDSLYVWAYSAPFGNYMVPFDGFGSFQQNYQDYVEMGVEYVMEQGFFTYAPNFHELRGYLNSKLMWDTSLDTDTLVRNFMRNYYGAGWESIYEFYTLWRLRQTELQQKGMKSYVAGQHVQDWCQPDLFPKALLDRYEALFDAALEANEAIRDENPELYTKYRDNIRAERCLIRYLELSTFPTYYDAETYSAMIDEFIDISGIKGFTAWTEFGGTTVEMMVSRWLDNLNNK